MISASKVMDVRAEDVFDVMMQSVAADVKQATHKNCKPKDIRKGFNYRKKLSRGGKKAPVVKVTVTDYLQDRIYEATFEGEDDKTVVRYELEPVDEDHVKVTYMEIYDESKNEKLMGKMQVANAKKNMKKTLDQMEKGMHQYLKEKAEKAKQDDEGIDSVEAIKEENTKPKKKWSFFKKGA